MPLTPSDIHNVRFSTPPTGKRGYNEDEVDAFLDLVEAELARLIDTIDELTSAAGTEAVPIWVGSTPENVGSPSSGIFISYRRGDERNFAGRLYERLSRYYDERLIFMDVDSIELGLDFHEVVQKWVSQCQVMLVVIGRKWLDATDPGGRRRIDNPDDFVRLEVEAALLRPGVRVIPIFVDGASTPAALELPGELVPLARRNGLQMSHEGFGSDFERLLRTLQRIMPS